MEAVVLVAVIALSLAIAVGAAFGSLALAMYLIEVATGWTTAPDRARLERAPAWTDAPVPERVGTTEHPIAA